MGISLVKFVSFCESCDQNVDRVSKKTQIQGSRSIVYFYIDGTKPQAGIDPPAQSHTSYEASALPPSHHGWITFIACKWNSFAGVR